MKDYKNAWFINFNGIGNGIIIAPLLKCFEESLPKLKYYHTENKVLSDKWFVKRAKLTNLLGFSPAKWRRFEKKYWNEITDFIRKKEISLIINLRNEGPKYDREYYILKEVLNKENVVFWDLNFKVIEKRKKQQNLTKDILLMLSRNGINMKSYNSEWLSSNNKRKNLGLGIIASQNNKKWPMEKWIELSKRLVSESNEKIILFAGTSKEDLKKAREIRRTIDLDKCEIIFKKPLSHVAKELGKLRCFVSNDTGLLHMSNAAETPTIGIYISTDPEVWSPHNKTRFSFCTNSFMKKCPARKKHCGNCQHYYDACTAVVKYGDNISPEQVFNSIEKMLRK